MLVREVQTHHPRPLLQAVCIGAFSIIAAVVFAGQFFELLERG